MNMHFNPRPPRGGRLKSVQKKYGDEEISIHAPREGGDLDGFRLFLLFPVISIHAPREGGDSQLQL